MSHLTQMCRAMISVLLRNPALYNLELTSHFNLSAYHQMKSIKYLLPVLLVIGGCKKLLDVQPRLQVDESQAIINASTAQTALNGLYNFLGNDNYYGSNYPALSYLSGGDIQWTGSQAAPQQIVLH